jgi:hypothetical protein
MKKQSIQQFCSLVEDMYQSFFTSSIRDSVHPFFHDIEDVVYKQSLNDEIRKEQMGVIPDSLLTSGHIFPLESIKQEHQRNSVQNNTVKKRKATRQEIYNLYESLQQYIPEDRTELNKLLQPLDEAELPGTIMPKEWKQLKAEWKHKKQDTFFICVLGAGPMGLFMANYVNYLKVRGHFKYYKDIQVIVLENRVGTHEGYKQPYQRSRPFQFQTEYFSIMLSKLYCNESRRLIPIRFLEEMFYIATYYQNIPMYFTKEYESWDSLKHLVDELGIQVLLDCSGGREKIPTQWKKKDTPSWYPYSMVSSKGSIDWNKKALQYEYQWKQSMNVLALPKHTFYLSLDIYKNGLYYYSDTIMIDSMETLQFFKTHIQPMGRISKKIFFRIIPHIPNVTIQKIFYYYYQLLHIHSIEMDIQVFQVNMHYRSRMTSVYKGKGHSMVYIGLGDTIFHSHFLVGAGLNRMIPLGVQVIHSLPRLFF